MLDFEDRRSVRLQYVQFGGQRWEARRDGRWWPYPSPDTFSWWEDMFGMEAYSEGRVINARKVARVLAATWADDRA